MKMGKTIVPNPSHPRFIRFPIPGGPVGLPATRLATAVSSCATDASCITTSTAGNARCSRYRLTKTGGTRGEMGG